MASRKLWCCAVVVAVSNFLNVVVSRADDSCGALFSAADSASVLAAAPLEEVVVRGIRGASHTPFTTAHLSSEVVAAFAAEGRELPFLLSRTPGVVAWSENGVGVGATYMRVRGEDDSRLNVSLDGLSLSSPEDSRVFWCNTNSYSAFLSAVDIQRGIAAAASGDGAFAGNIALTTLSGTGTEGQIKATVTAGSYGTVHAGATLTSGLIGGHWSVVASYHHTRTDGYMYGTAGNSGSFYASVTYHGPRFSVKYQQLFNYEHTGQAWNGVDSGDLLDGNYGVQTGLNSYRDFVRAGLGRYNNLVARVVLGADGSYSLAPYTLSDGRRWARTTDNFTQERDLLTLLYNINKVSRATLTAHYTYGDGYYDEYKNDCKLSKFGLADFLDPTTNATISRSDFLRKKGLCQHTVGLRGTVAYTQGPWDVTGGIAWQHFTGLHVGDLTYASDAALWSSLGGDDYCYYRGYGRKDETSLFLQGTYTLPCGVAFYGDVAYRHVYYHLFGENDKFLAAGDGYVNQRLTVSDTFDFLSPKVGIAYQKKGHTARVAVGVAHREPERNNYTDNGAYPAPRAERLVDIEVAYALSLPVVTFSATFYHMQYHNALMQTGQVSDIGEALTTNIHRAYRRGVELSVAVHPLSWCTVSGNIALSQNKVQDFDEYVENWDSGEMEVFHYDNSTLANAPQCVANLFVDGEYKGFSATWHTAFVSRQYLDNTAAKDRALPAYSTSSLAGGYTFPSRRHVLVHVQVAVDNLFNRHYAAAGWVYSALCPSAGNDNAHRYREIGYFPAAGTTVLATLTLTLR